MDKEKKVSVILVTFNSAKTIKPCLDSLLKAKSILEIIIVDNASLDPTLEELSAYKKYIQLIKSEKNLGFSKANNLGVKNAKSDLLLFLNPDTEVTGPESIENMVDVLVSNKDYGLIGPKLLYPDGKTQFSARNFPTVLNAFKEYLLGIKDSYDFYSPKESSLSPVDTVVGACMLTFREIFLAVGGFDEKYFLYYEDIALCQAIKKRGYKIGYLGSVSFKHVLGASGEGKPVSEYLSSSAKKYHGLTQYYLLQFIFLLSRIKARL